MEFKLPTLYKTTSTGAIQEWTIRVDKSGEDGVIVTRWGQTDGEIQETKDHVTEGKNLGKKNATTAYEQACAEAQAKWTKKQDKGYAELGAKGQVKTKAERIESGSVEPMLAEKWKDVVGKLDPRAFVLAQIKLNGLRGVARKENGEVFIYTRGGKLVLSVPEINAELQLLMPEGAVWDGELCTEDAKPTAAMFQRVMGAARRNRPTPDADLIFYHVFDNCTPGIAAKCYVDRIQEVVKYLAKVAGRVRIVEHKPITVAEVAEFEQELTAEGYEGAIVRIPSAPYEHKRTKALLKVKTFQDEEFLIVDVLPGRGIRTNMAGKVVVKLKDGTTNEAGVSGSHEQAKELLDNKAKYIGKMCTVRFFSYTGDGKLCFPVFYGVREAGE